MNKKMYLIVVAVGVGAVLLTILFYSLLGNRAPVIAGLAAEPKGVLPRGTCQIVCNAADPDGDELIYGWSANAGTITGGGATVTWTAPSSVGSYNVTVVVADNRGHAATETIAIEVRTNKAPVINSLTASPKRVLPGGSLNVTCEASDPNGDPMTYEWSASGGDIAGSGSKVTWTAPQQTGVYEVTVVVRDAFGGSATRTVFVSVALEQPPTITELRITKDRYGHCYLKPFSGGYYVGKQQNYDIQCVLADTSDASYDWSCSDGEIFETSEDGSMIAWAAPNTSCEVTITVVVSDSKGNMAAENLVLTVVSCSTCTFGTCGR